MIEIPVLLPRATYQVQIGSEILSQLPETLTAHCPAASYAIITDSIVSSHYRKTVFEAVSKIAPCHVFEFPAGETSKTRGVWANITDEMQKAGVGRDGAVIALGGGVVGDLAGFVAASYHRGISLVQIPTSLLAMVDSSIGGKTGVDTPYGKNLVGAFHQPKLVLADVATLQTLPVRELVAGVAETLKHGAIADAEYFEWIYGNRGAIQSKHPDALTRLVRRSVEIKAQVVAADEKEAGQRATLNFGHTVGHGLEAATAFEMLHGEAVSVGMVVEARLGEVMGMTAAGVSEQLRKHLAGFGLPAVIPRRSLVDGIIRVATTDKKNRAGELRFAPVGQIGKSARTKTGEWTFTVQVETLRTVLNSAVA